MKKTIRKRIRPMLPAIGSAAVAIAALTSLPGPAQAGDMAKLSLSVSEAKPGATITVRGSGFRMGTEASFIYTSTITVGGVPVGKVAGVDTTSANLHAGRTTDSGLFVAEHIDIDPEDTKPDGAFAARLVLPANLPPGEHDLRVTSCWGGPKEDYPQDGVLPCGKKGLGGGVNDRAATARLTVLAP